MKNSEYRHDGGVTGSRYVASNPKMHAMLPSRFEFRFRPPFCLPSPFGTTILKQAEMVPVP